MQLRTDAYAYANDSKESVELLTAMKPSVQKEEAYQQGRRGDDLVIRRQRLQQDIGCKAHHPRRRQGR